ncbi:MAG: phosphate regulon sensor histidine kinase PhoR [Pontibacterium sp.]
MRYQQRHAPWINLAIYLVFGLVIGVLVDVPVIGVLLALFVWCIRQIYQITRLSNWLLANEDDEPPESFGYWGEIYDTLAKRNKRFAARERHLKDVIERFQQSSAALPDAVVIVNDLDNLEWWNRSATKLLGLRDDYDRGKPIINLLRDPMFVRYFKRTDHSDNQPLMLPSPVDNDIELQYQITRFGLGSKLIVARDVTQMVRLEQTRQDFVANASHELRTPLTVIIGYLETYLDMPIPKPLERGLTQMQSQAKRMQNLVSDLLLLSRLESSRQSIEEKPVQLQSMIMHMVDAAKELSGERGHTFEIDINSDYDIKGQEMELHSAFSNLIYNAVRYTPDKGHIVIRWQVSSTEGEFSVTDNGIGIESKHISRLTERFYRVDSSRSSESGGTGLGLAIVKHVLWRHGANLDIKSQPGIGSTFSCHFRHDHMIKVDISTQADSA